MSDRSATRTDVLRASPPMFAGPGSTASRACTRSVPPLIFMPAITVLLVARGLAQDIGTTLLGIARRLRCCGRCASTGSTASMFHFEPEDGFGARLHWMVHGVHHDHPNDPMRLVMPPAVSRAAGAAVFVVAFVRGLRDAAGAGRLGAGFFAGYLAYDMLHYACTTTASPRTALERTLRELHMRHHFQDDTQRLRDQRAVLGRGVPDVLAARSDPRNERHRSPPSAPARESCPRAALDSRAPSSTTDPSR